MEYVWYAVAGVLGGILGGMGMGGGTLLIPLLSIFYSVNQHVAQAVNLISFIPMAIVAVIIHLKNKLIDFKGSMPIIISGIIACALGALLAKNINGTVLGKCFGGFLVILSIIQFITALNIKNEK